MPRTALSRRRWPRIVMAVLVVLMVPMSWENQQGEDADCITNAFEICTRNDHTALNDRARLGFPPIAEALVGKRSWQMKCLTDSTHATQR